MRHLAFLAPLVLLLALPGAARAGGDLPTAPDNSGAFTFQVPIEVPPGPTDASPALLLTYSSVAANGDAGVGFSLPYSAIRLDTSWGVPGSWLPEADLCDPAAFEGRLYLDGAELVPHRPPDGPGNGPCELRTRPDTYTRVHPVRGAGECGGAHSLPSGFAVVRADGTTWWYGSDDACDTVHVERADDAAGGSPTRWLLQHVQDRDGNLVTFHPERLDPLPEQPADWWTGERLAADDPGGCDGCLRAVTWARRLGDAVSAFGAAPHAVPPYAVDAAPQVGRFVDLQTDPGRFWPQAEDHFYAVQIDWEPRPDVRTSFVSGAPRRLDRRIRQVAVLGDATVSRTLGRVQVSGAATIRTYRLDYEVSTTGRSRLRRVWPFPGLYRADGDYGDALGIAGLPVDGTGDWTPMNHLDDAGLPNPWEFVWSENGVLADADEGVVQLPPADHLMDFPNDALPWMGAHWREGGYPTISMMDLNGDGLPEIVQHDDELPTYRTPVDSLVSTLGGSFVDQLPYPYEGGIADPAQTDDRFWVRWNQGDAFTDLVPGPVDPLALQEVGDYLPRIDCDGDGDLEDWASCRTVAAELSGQPSSGSLPALDELLDGEDICHQWWTGAPSQAGIPGMYVGPLGAWCEYRSCAPYCEPLTSVTFGPHSLADAGVFPRIDDLLEYVPNKAEGSAGGRSGGDLVLWRRLAVTQASSGNAMATLQGPQPFDPLLSGGIEPQSKSRWVDGYARASFSARLRDTAPLLYSDVESPEDSGLSIDHVLMHTVFDGLVQDTVDINGDGFPDRVLGGAAVLENHTGQSPTKYLAPDEAIFNDDDVATKGQAVSTDHMPWFVSLWDPGTGEWGPLLLWDLPLTDELLLGGPDELGLGSELDTRLFYTEAPGFGTLDVWESSQSAGLTPVSGSAGVSPSASGPSAGAAASLGPVSLGASVSSSGLGFSVGVGPVSFSTSGMSIGPVSIDYGGQVQGGAAGVFAAVWFAVTKALDSFSIPYNLGLSVSQEGFGHSMPGVGGDCSPCTTQVRWKRQGLVDMNGDGLLDYVIADNERWGDPSHPFFGERRWAVVLNEGDGFADEAIPWPGAPRYMEYIRTEPYRAQPDLNTNPGFRRSQTMAGLRDMNGDGLPDFTYSGRREGASGCHEPEQLADWGTHWSFDFLRHDGLIDPDVLTLCVQLNSGTSFLPAVDWFDGSVPDAVFATRPGFVPSLNGVRSYSEKSPTYNDGYAVGIVSLDDWNGDGLVDFTHMVGAGPAEGRLPVVYFNDGRRFVTQAPEGGAFDGWMVDTTSHIGAQATPPGITSNVFLRPQPHIDVSRTHNPPGGSVIQSAFLDLDGNGTLDWAQSVEDGELGPHIRLIPLQDEVPDLLTGVWEPQGAMRAVTYGPARDHLDLPFASRTDSLPDGSPTTDGVADAYPASSQVVVSQVLYDGLGVRGTEPVGLTYDYGDPELVHAGPSLTAGTGLKHPAWRYRSLGWSRIVTGPCPADAIGENGVCETARELEVVQDFERAWMLAGLPWSTRLFDGAGRLRSEEVTTWDTSRFSLQHAGDPDPRSAFGVVNWHAAAAVVESLVFDASGVGLRTGAAYDHEPQNGLVTCAVEDLDGDGWGDRLGWTGYDPLQLTDGKLDALASEVRSELPLGAIRADQPVSCAPGMSELSPPYAIQETTHLNWNTGRRMRSETRGGVGGAPPLVVSFDYLPNGQLVATTNSAGDTTWSLWDPVIGAHVIEEHAPTPGPTPHVAVTETCGVDAICPPAAWGQVRSTITPDGNVITTDYAASGQPIQQSDTVEAAPIAAIQTWPSRRIGPLSQPPTAFGAVPGRVATERTIDGTQSVETVQLVDGFGEPVVTAVQWTDELGEPGYKVEAAPRRDHRGLPTTAPWACFVPSSAFGVDMALAYDPAAPDLGFCASAPPVETFEHDALGRITRRVRPDGAEELVSYQHVSGGVQRDTTLLDPSWGPVVETSVLEQPFRVTTTRFGAVTFRHDLPAGLPAPLVPDASVLVTIEDRDVFGRRSEVWRTGNGNEVTRFRWDGFDRLLRYEDPDQGTWELDYDPDGRLAERRVLDAMGSVEAANRYRYDALGRVELEEAYDTAASYASGQPDTQVVWTFDVDPGTQAPTWTPLGAVGGEVGRAAEAVIQRWDHCDPMKWSDEQRFTWRYDQRGRVTEAAYAQVDCDWMGNGPDWMVTQSGYGPGDVEVARRVPETAELLTTTYDAVGHAATLDSTYGPVVTEASWELYGRPATLTYGNGVVQQYLYATGQQSSQALEQSSLWSGTGEVLFQRDYTWDAAGNLRSWVDAATPEGPEGESWSCDYDGVGTLLGCANDADPNEWMEYAYDVLGSLIHEDVRVDGADRVASQFSRGTGGLAPVPGMTGPLNAPVARVVGPTAEGVDREAMSLFYDARGHLVGQRYHDGGAAATATPSEAGLLDGAGGFLTPTAERTFQWSASGRLDRVLVGLGSPVRVSRYWYAPDGNRTAEQVTPETGASWTQARRFGGTRLTEELGGVVKQATTWSFAGNAVGQSHTDADPAVPGGQVVTLRWTGGDHLGSASVVTDEGGQLVRGVRYEPYGRVRDEWGPETDPDDYASAGLDDLFNGKPRTRDAFGMAGTERELEGYDYGARIYLPELARFASADTITPDLVWEANAFAYVRNNPLKYVDPDGHSVWLKVIKVLGKVAKSGWKATDFALTFKGIIDDWNTLTDPTLPFSDHLIASLSLCSEVLPLSVDDVRWLDDIADLDVVKRMLPSGGGGGSGVVSTIADAAADGVTDAARNGGALAKGMSKSGDDLARAGGGVVSGSGAIKGVDPNRLSHIFGKAEHALDDFVKASGGQEKAFARIQDAANHALKEGKLTVGRNGVLPGGDAGNLINVGGSQIRLIGGRVVDGKVTISSASRKGLR